MCIIDPVVYSGRHFGTIFPASGTATVTNQASANISGNTIFVRIVVGSYSPIHNIFYVSKSGLFDVFMRCIACSNGQCIQQTLIRYKSILPNSARKKRLSSVVRLEKNTILYARQAE